MNYKKDILRILTLPLVIIVSFFIIYLLFPKLFFFRGWEFFETYVYHKKDKLSYEVYETGDASRNYVFQKYKDNNNITVNNYGNRIACYKNSLEKSVLIIGNSTMFGSGLDDNETLPSLLCKQFPKTSIYNGARKHGLDLNKSKNLDFNTIFFATGERIGFKNYCNTKYHKPLEYYFIKDIDDKKFQLKKDNHFNFYKKQFKYLLSYLQKRSEIIMDPNQDIIAPNEQILLMRHSYNDKEILSELDCIKKIHTFFINKNYDIGFIYFPSKQTYLYERLKLDINDKTKNFIPNITRKMTSLNIKTFDTKKCINDYSKFSDKEIYNYHDTHLNSLGINVLFDCLTKSNLKEIFN